LELEGWKLNLTIMENADSLNLNVISYNLFGLNQGKSLLTDLCQSTSAEIIMTQEHWQSPVNMHKILNFSSSYTGYGISAMEGAISSSILKGRPYGGVCTLVHNSLLSHVKCLMCSERFVIISFESTIFVNVYLPTYSKENSTIITEILSDITGVICLYPNYKIVCGGDFNTVFPTDSSASKLIRSFMSNCKLTLCTDIIAPNCNYTFVKETQQHYSFIDYFMISTDIVDTLIQFKVRDDLINLSDHIPIHIAVCINVPESVLQLGDNVSQSKEKACSALPLRLRWDHCDVSHYCSATFSCIQSISQNLSVFYNTFVAPSVNDPVDYIDACSLRKSAIELIETSYTRLTNDLVHIANQTVPKMRKTTLKFWWNDELDSLKKCAWESNNEWISAGKPQSGFLADVRKSDKYAYKLAVRKFKQAESKGITDSLLESLANKDTDSFWKVWKSKLGASQALPKSVNGECNQQVIADNFSKYFASACSNNSTERNIQLHAEFNRMKAGYKRGASLYKWAVNEVKNFDLISNLKSGKASGLDNLTAEHLRYAHPSIAKLLADLFNLMICFEYVPDSFGVGVLIPIPKVSSGKGDVRTEDFRGISLNPIISKLFEQCLLRLFDKYLWSSNRQFGFKASSSCSHALYSVRKTIDYFVERQSTVNICGLDLSKAFDKLNRYGLFIKLMNRGCPMVLINILDCWFSKIFACVRWGDFTSGFVPLICGTRQGGVASPTLFAVFINDIIVKLEKSSLGCHIHFVCFNAFMYADDLLLLSLTVKDLQKMIDICQSELDWLDMKVNAKKSVCIRIGQRYNVCVSKLCIENETISWASELPYLGLVIKSAKNFKCCFHLKKIKFFRSVNGILSKLGSAPSINIALTLLNTNCYPILLYGLEALKLTKTDVSALSLPFNSIYMKLFQSFNKNVIRQCQFYCGELPLEYLLNLRTFIFYDKLRLSEFSPAGVLFKWLGKAEYDAIASLYNLMSCDNVVVIKKKIWETFSFNALIM